MLASVNSRTSRTPILYSTIQSSDSDIWQLLFGFNLHCRVLDWSHEHMLMVSAGDYEIAVGFKGRTVFFRRALRMLVTTTYKQCVRILNTEDSIQHALQQGWGDTRSGPFFVAEIQVLRGWLMFIWGIVENRVLSPIGMEVALFK